MAGTFPNTALAYPVTRILRNRVREMRFANGSCQTWVTQPQMNSWQLEYSKLKHADMLTLRDFFDLQKGAFDRTWTFTLDATNYNACQFEDDSFSYTEGADDFKTYSLSLKFGQIKKHGTIPTVAAVFPEIASGVKTQLPYATERAYKTLKTETDAGYAYTYSYRGSPLHSWALSFGAITDAELSTLMTFFLAMGGRHRPFSFTDPTTGTTHSICRFAQDRMEIRYTSKNVRSTSMQIMEYAA